MNGRKKLRSFDIIAMTQQSRFNYVPMSCAILTFVLHAAIIFNGEFVWDDRAAVLSNPDVLGQRSLLDLVSYDFWGQDMALEVTSTLVFDFALAHTLPISFSLCMHYHQISHKSWRPATVISLRLSHNLYGAKASGFHFDNVFIHAIITYCYAVLCFQLTTNYIGECNMARRAAVLTSIMFAVHPIHTEPVASIVGRSDLLCGLFFVVSITLYRIGRNEMNHYSMSHWQY